MRWRSSTRAPSNIIRGYFATTFISRGYNKKFIIGCNLRRIFVSTKFFSFKLSKLVSHFQEILVLYTRFCGELSTLKNFYKLKFHDKVDYHIFFYNFSENFSLIAEQRIQLMWLWNTIAVLWPSFSFFILSSLSRPVIWLGEDMRKIFYHEDLAYPFRGLNWSHDNI